MDVKMIALAMVFLVLTVSAAWPDDPLYQEGYNNQGNMDTAASKAVQDLRNNPQLAFGECSAAGSSVEVAKAVFANSLFALVIMAMAIALMYMAGNFFQIPNVAAMAKQELNEIMISGLIAMLFIGTIGFSSLLPQYLFGVDLFHEATNYGYTMLYKISSVSSVLISANIALNSIYTIYVPFGAIRKAMTMQLGPALRPLIDGVSFSLQFLITTYGEWAVFIFLFCFIEKWFLPFFFPVGLFLRSFPQTRGGGNTLIALSLALSTVYPLMFYLDSLIFADQFPASTSISLTYFGNAVKAIFAQLSLGGVGSIFGVLSVAYISPVMVAAIMLAGYMFADVATEVLHLVVMFSILLPVMNIFITLTLAREISRMLGTEINLSAFAKLI